MAVDIAMGIQPELVTEPAQSPDLNVNDLGFFASLKSRVWGINASTIEELVKTIFEQYEEYDGDALERVWQCLFKVYNQTLRKFGDNDLSVEHAGVRVRQRAGTLEWVVKYDVGAFQRAWDFLASSPSDSEDDYYLFIFRHFFSPWERGEIRPFWGRLIFLRPFGRMVQAPAAIYIWF